VIARTSPGGGGPRLAERAGALDGVDAAIAKARELAPDGSAIALIAAQIDSRQGNTEASVDSCVRR
jgi:hypothetical protein